MNDFRITRLPENWKIKAFEHCCKKISKSYKPTENGTTKYIGLEHIESGFPKLIGIGIESDIRSSKTQFCVNDVLFGKLRPYLRKAILAQFDGICSTDILVFRSDEKILPRFLIYLVHSDPFVKYAISTTTGVNHPRTSWNAIKNIKIPVPPIKEQKIIAGVLSLVQNAIAQQEKEIALTTELKKALMQKLFTEGTRKETQKQTEIGLIPESWEIKQLGKLAKLKSGGTPSRKKPEYWNEGSIPWVKTTEINYQYIEDTGEKITIEGLENSSAKIFPKGTLLMAMYGQGVTRGRVGILNIDAATNQACVAIIPNSEQDISTKYLYNYFYFNYDYLRQIGHGANQKNLSATILKLFPIAFPNRDIQDRISMILGKIDIKFGQHEQTKQKLQELFQTLLHQLMTAKIRVNELNLDSLNLDLEE